jgi:hypothetical protein
MAGSYDAAMGENHNRTTGRGHRSMVTLVVAVLAAVISVVGVKAPASAAPPNFAWKDNFAELCPSGCAANSGKQVQFWQSVLWADNIGGLIANERFIDGQFGPTTAARTRNWQGSPLMRDYEGKRLSVDGRAGPRTWSAADRNVLSSECGFEPSGEPLCTYYGFHIGRSFQFGLKSPGTRSNFWFLSPRTHQLVFPFA